MGVWTPGPGPTGGNDTFTGDATNETADGGAGDDALSGAGGDDTLIGGDGIDSLLGGAGLDNLSGGTGNDTLNGGADADIMAGGAGNDTYTVDSAGDVVTELANEGIDAISLGFSSAQDYVLPGNVENITAFGGFGAVVGNGLNNSVQASGFRPLYGLGGDDTLIGDGFIYGGDGNDTLTGSSFWFETLDGGPGDDFIDGGASAGASSAVASYTTATAGVTVSLAISGAQNTGGAGIDTLVNITQLTGSAHGDTLSGNAASNSLDGYLGADTLFGGDGDDVFTFTQLGAAGDDSIDGGAGFDRLILRGIATLDFSGPGASFASIEQLLFFSTISTTFLTTGQMLFSSDQFGPGGISNTLQVVGSESIVTESVVVKLSPGTASFSAAGWTFGVFVTGSVNATDYIQLVGTSDANALTGASVASRLDGAGGDDTLSGGASADFLDGGLGNDMLDGGAGGDAMTGGAGNDIYVVDSAGDVVTEVFGEGTDRVRTTLSAFTLGDNVENLTFIGAGPFSGVGNSLANEIVGGAGADTLDGGAGADALVGGLGDDIYLVDDAADSVVEIAGQGVDTVRSSISTFSLVALAHVDNVLLVEGSAAFTAIGNGAANVLTGNSASNVLEGGVGADLLHGNGGPDGLVGGAGNDTLLGGDGDDALSDGDGLDTLDGGAGVDSAAIFLSTRTGALIYVLGNAAVLENGVAATNVTNIERVEIYGGTGADQFTGGALDDTLGGGGGNDILDGGAGGLDTTFGGPGNDIHIVRNVGDEVVELAGQGIDTVHSFITYGLSDEVENLTLLGSDGLFGFGNALNNIIIGNAGANVLGGNGGVDVLIGGLGNDRYVIDNFSQTVVELAGEGADTLQTSLTNVSLADYANVENLAFILFGASFIGQGTNGANQIEGLFGNDYIYAYGGNDTGYGYAGVDVLLMGEGADLAFGGDGQDYMFGEAGADTIHGEEGVDVLLGGDGDDVMVGGAEGDFFYGEEGNDFGNGGAGNDIFVMTAGNDIASGDEGQDYFYMGDGNDVLFGGDGVDVMLGEAGDDQFNPGLGVDYVFMGTGSDWLNVDRSASGVTVLNDFTPGGASDDLIGLGGTGWTSFAQVQANITDFTASGGFCILTLDSDTSIWFIGVAPAQLTAGDFVFFGG